MNRPVNPAVKWLAVATLAGAHAPLLCAAPPQSELAYPVQPLELSLRQFAARTQIQLVYLSELVKGRIAPEVASGLSVEETLALMLADSGLTFRFLNERTVMVELADSVAGKNITHNTPGVSVFASTPFSGAPEKTSEEVEGPREVIVTGTRVKREAGFGYTVSAEEISRTGNVAIGDLLNDLPSMHSTFSQSSSSRFLGTTGLNLLDLRGLGAQRTLVLVNGRRHVASDILGNAVSPDVNTFPSDLIERIDVVTGGSSAVYGSDALSGVVNFVLQRDFEGLQVRSQGGQSSKNDGGTYSVSAVAGTNLLNDRGNIAANVEYSKQEPIFASDRRNLAQQGGFVVTDQDPGGADSDVDRRYFRDIRSTTIANGGKLLFAVPQGLDIAPCGRDAIGRAFACSYLFQQDGSLVPQTGTRIGLAPNGNFDGGNGTNNRERNALAIFPELARASLNIFGHLTLSDALEPFIEAKYVRIDSRRFGSPAFFQGGTMGGDVREQPRFDNPFLSDTVRAQINEARATVGLDPAAADTRFVLQRNMLDLGPRQEDARRETTRVVLGLTGEISEEWNYEVSANYGRFDEDTQVLGNLNMQRFLLAMDATRDGSGNIVCRSQIDPSAAIPLDGSDFAASLLANDVSSCVPMNPFGDGSITPAMRNYLVQDTTSVAKIEQFVTGATLTGDSSRWFELPAGPVGLAFGFEHRTEDVFFKSDDLVENGITFYNALPVLDPPEFEVSEAFAELGVPLLDGARWADELTVNVAGRYSDYKGETGGVVAHNYGLDWAPMGSLRFRVGKARAVRAPNLVDLYSAVGTSFAAVNDPCSVRNIGTGSATRAANCAAAGIPASYDYVYTATLEIQAGGNPDLSEETSDSLTAGFVFRPNLLPGFTLSADYFDIDIDNVITAPSAQQILEACYDSADLNNQFCGLFQRAGAEGGPSGEEPFRVIEGSLQQVALNYAKSSSRGIDLEMSYRKGIGGLGILGSRLVYTRTLQRDDFLNPADPGDRDQVLLELGDPRDAFNLSTELNRGPLSAGYDLRYVGKMVVGFAEDVLSVGGAPARNADFADRKYFPSVIYHDVHATYELNQALNIYAGVDNVTDKVPPLGLTGVGGGPATGTSGIYEPRGRFFYVGARYNFAGASGR